MLRHIVMWKVKEEALGLKKWEILAEMKFKLETLPAKISEIKSFNVGLNLDKSDTASDLVLISEFEDFDALHRYVVHPDHQKVVDFVKQVVAERRVVDFEEL